jgi:hypothetical protein
VELVVVARIDDGDDLIRRYGAHESREEPGRADTAGKSNEHARNVVRACSRPVF